MALDSGTNTNTDLDKIFQKGLPVTLGQESEISAYGVIKTLDIQNGVVIVTDLNGIQNMEATWPIKKVYVQP